MKFLTEPCLPYERPSAAAEPPAHISNILDRLDVYELRSLACFFAGAAPDRFEEKLLEIWDQRRRYQEMTAP